MQEIQEQEAEIRDMWLQKAERELLERIRQERTSEKRCGICGEILDRKDLEIFLESEQVCEECYLAYRGGW